MVETFISVVAAAAGPEALARWRARGVDLDALFAPLIAHERHLLSLEDATEAQEDAALAEARQALAAAKATVLAASADDPSAWVFDAAADKYYPDMVGPLGWIVFDADGREIGRL